MTTHHDDHGLEQQVLEDDGIFPNSQLPLLLYSRAVEPEDPDPAAAFERLFKENHWRSSWRDGIFPFHHYHSTAHEVLGVYQGQATVQLGGEAGIRRDIQAGDVIVIPAGVAHKRLSASGDFGVVGAYPEGQSWDMCYGKAGERPIADARIAVVPLPEADPVHGADGPLMKLWGG